MGTICHEHEGGGGKGNERFPEWPKWIREGKDLGIRNQEKGNGKITLKFCRMYFSHDQMYKHTLSLRNEITQSWHNLWINEHVKSWPSCRQHCRLMVSTSVLCTSRCCYCTPSLRSSSLHPSPGRFSARIRRRNGHIWGKFYIKHG